MHEPQATVSMERSQSFIIFAACWARIAYWSAGTWPSCHGPSISLPRHQSLTPYGSGWPFAARRSASRLPGGQLQYSTQSRASSGVPVPRLTVSIGVQSIFRQSARNSSVPKVLGSMALPGELAHGGAPVARAHAVPPVVAGGEVAAGVAHGGHAQARRASSTSVRKPAASACAAARDRTRLRRRPGRGAPGTRRTRGGPRDRRGARRGGGCGWFPWASFRSGRCCTSI